MLRRDVIKKKTKEAEKKYRAKVKFNNNAWNQYGSELAVGDLSAQERVILEEIFHLRALLAMPEIDMNQEELLEESNTTKGKILLLEKEIDDLERQKRVMGERLVVLMELEAIPLGT